MAETGAAADGGGGPAAAHGGREPSTGVAGDEGAGDLRAAGRRRAAALAGHAGDHATAGALLGDPAPAVRATALAALARTGAAGAADVAAALADPDAGVRRRACEVAVPFLAVDLLPLLADDDPTVVEVAAWALGEREAGAAGAVDALAAVAAGHRDALCREAAVAALGAIGDARGLPAILAATTDKATVRRRAILALAPFSDPDVDAALDAALSDRDWQVRQAAEDLTGRR
ncbi:MAG: HEAT repeat domain-containing protein [Acidimicrobiales bacterium]